MIKKITFIFLVAMIVALTAYSAVGQETTPDLEERKRRIEQKEQELELKEREVKLERRDLELEREREEIRRTREKIRTTPNNPDNSNSVTPQESVPPVTNSQIQPQPSVQSPTSSDSSNGNTTPQNTASTNSDNGNNTQQDECTSQALDPDNENSTEFNQAICNIIESILEQNRNGTLNNPLSTRNNGQQVTNILAAKLATNPLVRAFFLESEKKRTDKQVGAPPKTDGTTSLVVKGGTPALIGWAVEQGAATSSVSGNTVTVRANPFNLAKALFYNQGIIPIMDVEPNEDAFNKFLKKLSFGVSFDTTRDVETPTFTGNRQQVSAVSFRYEFINHRNPLAKRNDIVRNAFFTSQNDNLNLIARSIFRIVNRGSDRFLDQFDVLNQWLDETNRQLSGIPASVTDEARRAQVTAIIKSRVQELPFDQLSNNAEIKEILDDFGRAVIGFKEGRDKLLEDLNKGTVVSFEYTNYREPIKPDTSNFRFIFEKGILRNTDFTFNASLTMYNRKPNVMNVSRIRDFQLALQTDTKLPIRSELGDFQLSFAGRYERLNSDTVDELGVIVPGTKGDIAYGQMKLTIPLLNWGIKLPLSLTFANRTELIKESHVRANFGFTFDLDPIFGRFKPF